MNLRYSAVASVFCQGVIGSADANAEGAIEGFGGEMKKFLEISFNVRIVGAEIGVTATALFLVAFGTYKAWEEFIAKLLRK